MIADMKANNEANANLEKAIEEDPEFAAFINAKVVKNKTLAEAALEAGIDLSEAIPEPGEEGYDQYVIAREEKRKAGLKANDFKQKREQNLQRSISEVQRYFSEKKIDEKQAKEIGNRLDQVFDDIYNGKVSADFIKLIHEGMTAKDKIANAKMVGEIKGRNDQIKLRKRTFRRGDGQKKLGGTKSSIQSQPKVTYADDGIEHVMAMMEEK